MPAPPSRKDPLPLPPCTSPLRSLSVNPGSRSWPWTAVTGRRRPAGWSLRSPRSMTTGCTNTSTASRPSLHHGDLNGTSRQLTQAMGALPSATRLLPFVAVGLRLQLARAYLALADMATARQLLREIDDILRHCPALGTLTGEVEEFRGLTSGATTGAAGRPPLTPAELRLLPYLQTHLTADRIAERLFVSSWTVKTEVKAIYRKLGVSSRNDAVQKAAAIGLLST